MADISDHFDTMLQVREVPQKPQKVTFGRMRHSFGTSFVELFVRINMYFRVFSAELFVHAFRMYCDWHSKHKKKIPQRPKVDLVW